MSGSSRVHVITGVRRSGKTVLMLQLKDRLEEQGVHAVYLDAEALPPDADLADRVHRLIGSPDDAVLIDEACSCEGWEDAVDALHREGTCLYLSSSRADPLHMGTEHDPVHILPLSFREFLERYPVCGDEREDRRFDEYAKQGGMPILDPGDGLHRNAVILEGVLDSVICRDVMRSSTGLSAATDLMRFLFMNIGNTVTMRQMTQASGVSSRTAEKHLRSLTDSHLFYRADVYDLTAGRPMKTRARFYACDTGVRNAALFHSDDRSPGIPENIVFLELMRRGYRVSSGVYRDHTVDLIAERDGSVLYVQVARTLSDERVRRMKERPLRLLGDGGKLILALDRRLPPDSKGIRYRNLIGFLLGRA